MRSRSQRRTFAGARLTAGVVALAVLVAGCSVFGGDGPAVASEVRVVSPLSCEVSGCVGEGIDTATGAYTTQVEDLVYPAGVYGVELARSYRSDRATNGWFGPGWVSIYETTVTADGDLVTVDAPAGLVPRWRPEAPDGWTVTGSVTVSALGDGRWGLVWPTGERWSFDRDGRLSEMRSPYGQTVTVTRTDEGSVTVASSQGPSLTLSITSGRVVSVSTDDGREVTYGYDTGALASVAAPGLVQQYRYDDAQQLVEVTSPVGTTTMVFGAAKVVGQTTASGQRVVVDYGPDGTTVEAGTVREYRHDGDGRLTRVVEDGVDIEVRAFDASGNLVKARRIARPTGQVVSDLARVFESGRLVRETVNGTARSFIYDSQGRVTGIAVADGTTSFEYDGGSPLPTAVDAPSSGRVVFEYLDGYVTSTSDATGATTVVTQDALGNPVATTTGDQDPWRYEFDAEGNVESTTAPSGRVWRAEWAPRSTLVSETDPLGRRTTYEHDDAGRLVEVTDPAGRITAYVYDDRGRVVLERRPDGLATGYEYMADGRLAATILPGERAWRTETEQRADGGTTVTVTAPDGTMTVSTVDTAGRETSRQVLEADGTLVESHRFEFDYDRPAVTVVERGTSRFETRTTYDSGGNIASTVETLDGVEVGRTEYRHVAGRVVEAANTATTVTYGYDDAGRLSDVASGDDRWAAVYESGRLIATSHNDRTTTIGYDIDGRATSFVDPTGTTIDWVLDDIDRPIMRTVGDTAATYAWSDTDQLAQYRAPDGRTWTWTHDPADRIVEAVEPSGSITTYEYVNGVIARIRSDSDQHSNGEFSYNERGLLARAGEVSYEYDATGLPTVIGADDLTEEWSYDARGNVATVTSDGDTYALGYTPAGQLETVTGPSRSLTAEWGNDGLVAVGVGDSDPIRLRTEDGRLVGIDWDSNTQIDLDWSDDATRLSVSERGNDDTRQFEIRDGRLTEFESGDLWVSADHRDDGTLEVLRVIDDQSDSTVRFDPLGRPETLTNGTRTATLGYDDTGRVTSLQTSTGQDLSDTTITYDNDGQWDIDGDDEILEELFESDGSLLSPLPDSVVNPLPVSLNSESFGLDNLASAGQLLVAPEPRPLLEINRALQQVTPQLLTPIGVNDLGALGEQMALAAITRLAPSFTIHGDSAVRLPLIDPENDNVAAVNPFLGTSGIGRPVAAINQEDRSWLDRRLDDVGDVLQQFGNLVSPLVDVLGDIAGAIIENPIARLVVVAGTWITATALCPLSGACIPIAAAASLLAIADGAYNLATSGIGGLRACSDLELASCGIQLGSAALGVAQLAAGTTLGVQLLATRAALGALAAVSETGVGIAQASGRVGVAKSDVLATLRAERVIAREVPVCAGQVCARIDSVTQTVFGRLRYVESKNGVGARFTPNQQIVYPTLRTTGGYLPRGLAGRPPQMIVSTIDVQHWGAPATPLALP